MGFDAPFIGVLPGLLGLRVFLGCFSWLGHILYQFLRFSLVLQVPGVGFQKLLKYSSLL